MSSHISDYSAAQRSVPARVSVGYSAEIDDQHGGQIRLRAQSAPKMLRQNPSESRPTLRTPAARALIAATLSLCLMLSAAVIVVARLNSGGGEALAYPGDPASDAASLGQVVTAAKQVVGVAGLHATTAGYSLMSCKNQDAPPYQGAIYLNFALPADAHADAFFGSVASKLTGHGWVEGRPPAQHVFGKTVSKDGITAMIYRESTDAATGVLRMYGPCQNMNDHRRDAAVWTDITGEFSQMH
ncbi:hypothetical protein [Mycobacterium kubicae]|uniref:hypothetical protein n=1 Tax=Mycobacterium kubicae TaxID=120959 RepID=UPI001F615360|nr:hypothetical protein [Mycobacterium kubicae]